MSPDLLLPIPENEHTSNLRHAPRAARTRLKTRLGTGLTATTRLLTLTCSEVQKTHTFRFLRHAEMSCLKIRKCACRSKVSAAPSLTRN